MQPPIGFVPEGFVELFGVSGRNYLLNAEFQINQRQGTTYDSQTLGTTTSANFYTLDRWRWSASSTANTGAVARVQITREVFNAEQTDVDGSPRYFLRVTNLTTSAIASDRQHSIKQNIENVNRVANKNITISFWAKSSIAGKQIGVMLNPIQSTNGTRPANTYNTPTQTFSLTSNWQKFTFTTKVTLTAGFIVGTSGNDNMEFSIFLDYLPPSGGTTFVGAWEGTGTTDFANIQIEGGIEPTDFEVRQPALDLMMCQRYFWRNASLMVGIGFNDTFARQVFPFILPVPMRASPTVTSTSLTVYDGSGVTTKTFKTSTSFSNQHLFLEYNNAGVTTIFIVSMYTQASEFITASAEY
jgi:hypothetical protein